MTWANPEYFWLLLIIPVLIAYYIWSGKRKNAALQISSLSRFGKQQRTWKHYLRHSMFALRTLAVALIIVALARPQSSSSRQDVTVEGIDIVTALDISGSMKAEDFKPNRLEAAKSVLIDFIDGRVNDRIGLVIFAGESFTQSPLTTDRTVLKNLVKQINFDMIEDGTAIGDGMATAINRLKDSEAISKVIILLTDGENNSGSIDPLSAADIAKTYGIRIYTIGVGTIGRAPVAYDTPFGKRYTDMEVRIDEPLLTQVAEITGGQYFRATGNKKLEEIYKEIDQLEKSKIDVTEFHKKYEEFLPLAVLALIALGLEFLLRMTIFRRIP
ncbi:MAG: VWA domain-containing protein [Bacteroidales bacterium]|nr:VWA domain-containing protein [Bacteroidales bacterium]